VFFCAWRAAAVRSSPERDIPPPHPVSLKSVLAVEGQHAFALGTVIALDGGGCWPARPDLGERWPSRLVATTGKKNA